MINLIRWSADHLNDLGMCTCRTSTAAGPSGTFSGTACLVYSITAVAAELFGKVAAELCSTVSLRVSCPFGCIHRARARIRLWAKGDRSAKRRRVTETPYVPNMCTFSTQPFIDTPIKNKNLSTDVHHAEKRQLHSLSLVERLL